ncbi:X-linked lymphocyte-regulated protein 3A-like [Meriones unguiculatus]|uniref:X-linked lymphocyte-regulated protein 3A-like n=1 Tax=Meriones unguiculatus TaxID=10047 RepID=UPI00293F072F|nr:X-linked lymphocyte-regulated protein 3A-like [Meriones unguiculatus]
MSSREMEATDSAGMHPRQDPTVASDDTLNIDAITAGLQWTSPAEALQVGKHQAFGHKEGTGECSGGPEDGSTTWSLPEPRNISRGPLKIFLKENRERIRSIINESFQTMQKKVEDVLKVQGELRQKLYEQYSLQIKNLNWKLNVDAGQVKKQAEKLSRIFKKQCKFVLQSLVLQKEKMEEFKSLCEQYLEKLEMLKYSWENSMAEELRGLIDTLEMKLLMVNRQQESIAARLSLLDVLLS